MSLLTVISEHSAAVFTVCIPGLILSAGYIAWKTVLGGGSSRPAVPPVNRVTPRRPQAPMPLAKPKSLEAGMVEHQVRGEAKTVKVAVVPSAVPPRDERQADTARMPALDDDDAKDSLFSGLDAKPESQTENKAEKKEDTTILRQAERMEELGFHKEVIKTAVIPEADNNKTEVLKAPAPTFRIPGQASVAVAVPTPLTPPTQKPANIKSDPKRAETRSGDEPVVPAATPVNRTQTQELDDILSRIDKVLAENPVLATTTLGSASGEATVGPKPVPPRPEENRVDKKSDKTDDPTGQQKLF